MKTKNVVIVGAGPYGLSAASYLKAAGLDPYLVGQPMGFWKQNMPSGMILRSTNEACNIAAPQKGLSLMAYLQTLGKKLVDPSPIEDFVAYGEWFLKKISPTLDTRFIRNISRQGNGFNLTFDDGEQIQSKSVVLTLGIGQFARRPELFKDVPRELAPHSSNLSNLAQFKGKRVAVIGKGQSALEYAAILHEHQADVEILTRSATIDYLSPRWRLPIFRALTPGPLRPWSYALRPPTDLGDFRTGRIIADPDKFRKQPPDVRESLLGAARRPVGSHWLRPRLKNVRVRTRTSVSSVEVVDDRLKLMLSDGHTDWVDRVILATGYSIDISRYQMLDESLKRELETESGYPVLTASLESSIPGLYVAGVIAERTLGPTLRFVCGTCNVGPRLAAAMTRK